QGYNEAEARQKTIEYLIEHNLLESHIEFLKSNNLDIVADSDWLKSLQESQNQNKTIEMDEPLAGEVEEGNIGEGFGVVKDYLSKEEQKPQAITAALQLINEKNLISDQLIKDRAKINEVATEIIEFLQDNKRIGLSQLNNYLETKGLYPGWGNTANKVITRLEGLLNLLKNGDLSVLKELPLVRSVIMTSVHGWFAQDKVLGRPDTGGQVVYVLGQASAMGWELKKKLLESGIEDDPQVIVLTRLIQESDGTTCDQPIEHVRGAPKFVNILRVPFRGTANWISRYKIWPYIDTFIDDADKSIRDYLSEKSLNLPDVVMGNYSDGNLVATVLAQRYQALQQGMSHALELPSFFKGKVSSDKSTWEKLHKQYYLPLMVLSDLIYAKSADISFANSSNDIEEFAAYGDFTIPGYFKLLGRVNPKNAKFNENAPGTNLDLFTHESSPKDAPAIKEFEEKIFKQLDNPSKPAILTLARLERKKNLLGLVEAYANDFSLQEAANLILICTKPGTEGASPEEEKLGRKIESIIKENELEGKVSWGDPITDQKKVAVIYRMVSEIKGVFVQPALTESFGLTVIEAAASGLPVVATKNGGPEKILKLLYGNNDHNFNPTDTDDIALKIKEVLGSLELWQKLYQQGIENVGKKYSWERHVNDALEMFAYYSVYKRIRGDDYKRRQKEVNQIYQFWRRLVQKTAAPEEKSQSALINEEIEKGKASSAISESALQQKKDQKGLKNVLFVSFRLNGLDGVSLETRKWTDVFMSLGFNNFYYSGETEFGESVVDGRSFKKAHFLNPEISELTERIFTKGDINWEDFRVIHQIEDEIYQDLKEYIKKKKITHLVAENILSFPGNIALSLAFIKVANELDLPVISHCHDFWWERDRFRLNTNDTTRSLLNELIVGIRNLVTVDINSFQHQKLAKIGVEDVFDAPNVMDFENPNLADESRMSIFRRLCGVEKEDIFLLVPVRRVPRKELRLAIDAASVLHYNSGRSVRLVFTHSVADEGGEYWEEIKEYADAKEGIFIVDINKEIMKQHLFSLKEAYLFCDAVIYTSIWEGWGNALGEAIYYKKPVIINPYPVYLKDIKTKGIKCIEIKSHKKIVEGKEIYVVEDGKTLAEKILAALRNPSQYTEHNYQVGLREFSYKKLKEIILKALDILELKDTNNANNKPDIFFNHNVSASKDNKDRGYLDKTQEEVIQRLKEYLNQGVDIKELKSDENKEIFSALIRALKFLNGYSKIDLARAPPVYIIDSKDQPFFGATYSLDLDIEGIAHNAIYLEKSFLEKLLNSDDPDLSLTSVFVHELNNNPDHNQNVKQEEAFASYMQLRRGIERLFRQWPGLWGDYNALAKVLCQQLPVKVVKFYSQKIVLKSLDDRYYLKFNNEPDYNFEKEKIFFQNNLDPFNSNQFVYYHDFARAFIFRNVSYQNNWVTLFDYMHNGKISQEGLNSGVRSLAKALANIHNSNLPDQRQFYRDQNFAARSERMKSRQEFLANSGYLDIPSKEDIEGLTSYVQDKELVMNHGDPSPWNLFVDPWTGEGKAIIDAESSHIGTRSKDLAKVIIALIDIRKNNKYLITRLEPLLNTFFETYFAETGVSPETIWASLPYYLASQLLWYTEETARMFGNYPWVQWRLELLNWVVGQNSFDIHSLGEFLRQSKEGISFNKVEFSEVYLRTQDQQGNQKDIKVVPGQPIKANQFGEVYCFIKAKLDSPNINVLGLGEVVTQFQTDANKGYWHQVRSLELFEISDSYVIFKGMLLLKKPSGSENPYKISARVSTDYGKTWNQVPKAQWLSAGLEYSPEVLESQRWQEEVNKDYHAVMLDFDGVLKDYNQAKVSDEVGKKIADLLEREVPLAFVTTRGSADSIDKMLTRIRQELEEKEFYIDPNLIHIYLQGGTYGYNYGSLDTYYHRKMKTDVGKKVIKRLKADDLNRFIYRSSIKDEGNRIHFVFRGGISQTYFTKAINEIFTDISLSLSQPVEVLHTDDYYEITVKGANKRMALVDFSSRTGVAIENILRVGDQGQEYGVDRPMLEKQSGGFSVYHRDMKSIYPLGTVAIGKRGTNGLKWLLDNLNIFKISLKQTKQADSKSSKPEQVKQDLQPLEGLDVDKLINYLSQSSFIVDATLEAFHKQLINPQAQQALASGGLGFLAGETFNSWAKVGQVALGFMPLYENYVDPSTGDLIWVDWDKQEGVQPLEKKNVEFNGKSWETRFYILNADGTPVILVRQPEINYRLYPAEHDKVRQMAFLGRAYVEFFKQIIGFAPSILRLNEPQLFFLVTAIDNDLDWYSFFTDKQSIHKITEILLTTHTPESAALPVYDNMGWLQAQIGEGMVPEDKVGEGRLNLARSLAEDSRVKIINAVSQEHAEVTRKVILQNTAEKIVGITNGSDPQQWKSQEIIDLEQQKKNLTGEDLFKAGEVAKEKLNQHLMDKLGYGFSDLERP
ncbi:MAG: glycosyltransferase, partial [Candidatus Omnitrophica bacterium]|nr:glycosyltransferase [Candidatus Omnitrophota bacterium]